MTSVHSIRLVEDFLRKTFQPEVPVADSQLRQFRDEHVASPPNPMAETCFLDVQFDTTSDVAHVSTSCGTGVVLTSQAIEEGRLKVHSPFCPQCGSPRNTREHRFHELPF